MTRSIRSAALVWPLAFSPLPWVVTGQATCARPGSEKGSTLARQCPSPLDRLVSLRERDVLLRDALDRLAAAARIRLAYSAELLPLDWGMCVRYRSVAAGTVLKEMLAGIALEPVVTDSDRVVLAPARARESGAGAPASTRRAGVPDRVVVTGCGSSRQRVYLLGTRASAARARSG